MHAYNRGVLYENMGAHDDALACYRECLRIALESNDATSEALACNAIGVSLQTRAVAGLSAASHDAGELEGTVTQLTQEDESLLREALSYHEQHAQALVHPPAAMQLSQPLL